MPDDRKQVVDLFAGGGGVSLGIKAALGYSPHVAVNHWPLAIRVHERNHPETKHFIRSVYQVKPEEAVGGSGVWLLWASPDCTTHSVAKGGVPVQQKIRMLPYSVIPWAARVRPDVIIVENVQELRKWGPLLPGKGGKRKPDPERTGETFRAWIRKLERLGYAVDHRVLVACDYGAPTRRKRLFVIARRDGQPIVWPEPTHGSPEACRQNPELKPWRTAAECIDWSIPCPSIFNRKTKRGKPRPLAEKTLWRIWKGLDRFVLRNPRPFIVDPLRVPFLVKANHGKKQARGEQIDMPVSTIPAARRGHALVAAFLAKHYSGVVGVPLGERPMDTITAVDHHAPVTATLVKLRGECSGADLHEPVPAITAKGNHVALVRAFLTTYYESDGTGGQALTDPMRTITAKARLGLVTITTAEGPVEYQIVDIGMRMLEPHELLAATCGQYAEGYDLSPAKTKAAKVRLIGNMVPPELVEAVVRANAPKGAVRKQAA